MKPARGLIPVIGIALLAASVAQAQSWETVDEIFPGASANGLTTDNAGNVFVAGSIKDASGVTHAIVMKSIDQGSSWDSNPLTPDVDEPSDTFTSSNGSNAAFAGIASASIAAESHLVTAGTAEGFHWLIRRSIDAGATWVTLDLFNYSSAVVSGGPRKPALDSNGNIYVGGSVTEQVSTTIKGKTTTTTVTRNLIRKFEAGAWKTIETAFPLVRLVCAGSSVFAAGASGNGSWQVRKSSDGGNTWSLIDDYRFDASSSTIAYDMAADSQGTLFVVGSGSRLTTSGRGRTATTMSERFWIVRKGTAGGAQWMTIDVFDLGRPPFDAGGGNYYGAMNFAKAVTLDSQDNVHVTGVGVGPQENLQHWVTRRLTAGTGTWTITDDFNLFPGASSTQGSGIAADPFGNLFASGFSEAGGLHGWQVRRMLAP